MNIIYYFFTFFLSSSVSNTYMMDKDTQSKEQIFHYLYVFSSSLVLFESFLCSLNGDIFRLSSVHV